MRIILFFHLTVGILLLQSCVGAPLKRVQAQNNDEISVTEINTDTILYDTTNFKTMKSQEKYTVIKQFDIQRYNNNGGGDIEFIDREGIHVRQWSGEDDSEGIYYIDERHYPDSPYLYYCEYDQAGRIKMFLTNFYSMIVGEITYYDTAGNIVKATDEDAAYKFSVDDLILKMKREYDVDIENIEKIRSVVRSEASVFDFPLYEVDYYIKQDTYCRCYLINGNTGETLYISERAAVESDMGDCVESLVDEYKRVKKIK